MRYLFKRSYLADIRLAKHEGHVRSYGALALLALAAPWLAPDYWVAQLTFVLIYGVAGLGLMLLVGYTGQFSIGHAALLGIGAYAQAVLVGIGWPFPLALVSAALLSGAAGLLVGLPAARVTGIYLAVATVSFGFLVEEVLARWESVTGGSGGKQVAAPMLFGYNFAGTLPFYYLCLGVAVTVTLLLLNLLRTPTGRRFIAIRDSEISAKSLGIDPMRCKAIAFGLSAAIAGLAGALYAHKLKFLSPDQFSIFQSIELLLMIIVGGIGSVHGAFLGAAFVIAVPQLIAVAKDVLPTAVAQAPGLQALVYGVILIVLLLYEPTGIYGRWIKIRTYFELFPYYRKGLHRRQRAYHRSERLR